MVDNDKLFELAKSLQLFNLANNSEELIKKAIDENLSIKDAITFFLTEEYNDKQHRFALNRISRAQINQTMSFENFDFSRLSSTDETLVRNIMNTDFIGNNENFIFIGHHGLGKTHLGTALVRKACFDGKTGYSDFTKNMCRKLVVGHKIGDWYNVAKNYLDCDILFLQDVATVPLDIEEVVALYEIISLRENHGSIITETCVSPKDWFGKMASDNVLVSGIIDRLKQNSIIIKFEGESYRGKEHKK